MDGEQSHSEGANPEATKESLFQKGIKSLWGYFKETREEPADGGEGGSAHAKEPQQEIVEAGQEEEASQNERDSSEEEKDGEEEDEICKFFLEGRCRFEERCHFRHPQNLAPASTGDGSKKKRRRKEKREAEKDRGKKRPMKTAMDVIQRIQWDADLPTEYFFIGYTDRFKGIQEEPFSRFSNWGDLPNADYDALAVPQHRIQYFKYKDTKVWDKSTRLDLVFGSTDNGCGEEGGIVGVMDRVDERIRLQLAEETTNIYSEDELSEDDYDSDCNDIAVNVGPVDCGEIIASKVNHIPEEERSTHFLAIRVTDPEIASNVDRLQQRIVDQEEELSDCCMSRGLLHVTLGMLRLSGERGENEAREMMEDLRPILNEFSRRRLVLRIRGLDTFGQRVLYAKVNSEPQESDFWEFVSAVKNRVALTSDAVSVTNKFEFTPHLTICKVNRTVSRLRRSKYLPSALYESMSETDFGVQPLDNLQLCVIEQTTRFDGFYTTVKEILVSDEA